MKQRLMYLLIATVGLAAGVYFVLVGAVWVMQEQMIFPGSMMGRGVPLPYAPDVVVERLPLPEGEASFRIAIAEPEQPRGVLLYFCGNGETLHSGMMQAQAFAEYGLISIAVEYPGYGDSEGKLGERDFEAAAEVAADFAAVRAAELELPFFLCGRSLGSFLATYLAAQGRGDRLLLVTPPTSMVAAASQHYGWLPVSLLLRHRFDSLARAPQVHCPALVLHGDRDGIVPLAMGQELAAALPEAELVIAEGYGHNDLPTDRHGDFGDRIAAFFGL